LLWVVLKWPVKASKQPIVQIDPREIRRVARATQVKRDW